MFRSLKQLAKSERRNPFPNIHWITLSSYCCELSRSNGLEVHIGARWRVWRENEGVGDNFLAEYWQEIAGAAETLYLGKGKVLIRLIRVKGGDA